MQKEMRTTQDQVREDKGSYVYSRAVQGKSNVSY